MDHGRPKSQRQGYPNIGEQNGISILGFRQYAPPALMCAPTPILGVAGRQAPLGILGTVPNCSAGAIFDDSHLNPSAAHPLSFVTSHDQRPFGRLRASPLIELLQISKSDAQARFSLRATKERVKMRPPLNAKRAH